MLDNIKNMTSVAVASSRHASWHRSSCCFFRIHKSRIFICRLRRFSLRAKRRVSCNLICSTDASQRRMYFRNISDVFCPYEQPCNFNTFFYYFLNIAYHLNNYSSFSDYGKTLTSTEKKDLLSSSA